MTPARRWAVVAAVLLAVVAVPLVPRVLPVRAADVTTADLLDRVRASASVAHSGLVETSGAVQLPVGGDLGEVGELLAGSNRLRVWWRDPDAWRVDRLQVTGEQDLVHAGPVTTAFDYERLRATVTLDPEVRLPRVADLLPPALARAALEDVDAADVTRLDDRRVAGVAAAGLRYEPSGDQARRSTVRRVDVWADPRSGLPLRVEVTADGAPRPDVVTAFTEVDLDRPDDDVLAFRPAPGVEVRRERAVDIADAAGRYAPYAVPPVLAGLERRTDEGAAGVYGTGVSRLVLVPLRPREADPLRERLRAAPGAEASGRRTTVGAGVLTVLLTGSEGPRGTAWLVAGTVPPAVLGEVADAAVALPFVERGDR